MSARREPHRPSCSNTCVILCLLTISFFIFLSGAQDKRLGDDMVHQAQLMNPTLHFRSLGNNSCWIQHVLHLQDSTTGRRPKCIDSYVYLVALVGDTNSTLYRTNATEDTGVREFGTTGSGNYYSNTDDHSDACARSRHLPLRPPKKKNATYVECWEATDDYFNSDYYYCGNYPRCVKIFTPLHREYQVLVRGRDLVFTGVVLMGVASVVVIGGVVRLCQIEKEKKRTNGGRVVRPTRGGGNERVGSLQMVPGVGERGTRGRRGRRESGGRSSRYVVEASREPPMVPMVPLPVGEVGAVGAVGAVGQPLQSVQPLPVVQGHVPMARVQLELQHEQRPQESLIGVVVLGNHSLDREQY